MTSWTEALQHVRVAIDEARDELGQLDAAAGDGDLGLTMTAAADGAVALAERGGLDGKTTAEALRALGMELARVAPSTSGTLFARGLLQASRAAAAMAADLGDAAGGAAQLSRVAQSAALLRAAIEGIQKAGKAQPGDRTMLDALVPAAQALERAAARGDSPKAAADAAALAAWEGAAATKEMEPKIGRASWIAERAQGNVDAGACAIAVIATAIASAIA
jgi:dihydroxyacetone kinase